MALRTVPPPLQRKKLLARSAAEFLVDMSNQPLPKRARVEPTKTMDKPKAVVSTRCSLLESLPSELFGQVLSFIGPTSNGLTALSQVNQNLQTTLTRAARAMLPKATLHFRDPLPRMPNESCTSLFLRHTRACTRVVEELKELRACVDKDVSDLSVKESEHNMDKAMALLHVSPTLSVSLENVVLAVCGKCGGKAFKLNKRALLVSMGQPSVDTSVSGLQRRRKMLARHQERLDLSCLIMQMVLFRKLQLARKARAPSCPPTRVAVNPPIVTNWH